MRGLGLGFTNPVETGRVLDVCVGRGVISWNLVGPPSYVVAVRK